MAGVGLSSNVEVLLRVFWELLEKESEECVDVLASCDSVADGASAIRIANIDWLIKKDH